METDTGAGLLELASKLPGSQHALLAAYQQLVNRRQVARRSGTQKQLPNLPQCWSQEHVYQPSACVSAHQASHRYITAIRRASPPTSQPHTPQQRCHATITHLVTQLHNHVTAPRRRHITAPHHSATSCTSPPPPSLSLQARGMGEVPVSVPGQGRGRAQQRQLSARGGVRGWPVSRHPG